MIHYVYKLIEKDSGYFYFGSRTFDGDDIKDDSYMGSMVTWQPDRSKLTKIVIKDDFPTRESANEYEANLIRENIDSSLNKNFQIPSGAYYTFDGKLGYWSGKVGPMKDKTHTNETKEKLRENALGREVSDQTRRKMSEAHTGKVKDKTWRENLSKSLTGKKKSKEHIEKLKTVHKIPVAQFNTDMEFIRIWNGAIDVKNELGINHISSVCKGKAKTAGGFVWRYVDDVRDLINNK